MMIGVFAHTKYACLCKHDTQILTCMCVYMNTCTCIYLHMCGCVNVQVALPANAEYAEVCKRGGERGREGER